MSVTTLFIILYLVWGCIVAEEIAATSTTTKYDMNVATRFLSVVFLILIAPIVRVALSIELIYRETKD